MSDSRQERAASRWHVEVVDRVVQALIPPKCRDATCDAYAREDSIWCERHRYPEPSARDECLHTHCRARRLDETPWCSEHTRQAASADELQALRLRLEAVRAAVSALVSPALKGETR